MNANCFSHMWPIATNPWLILYFKIYLNPIVIACLAQSLTVMRAIAADLFVEFLSKEMDEEALKSNFDDNKSLRRSRQEELKKYREAMQCSVARDAIEGFWPLTKAIPNKGRLVRHRRHCWGRWSFNSILDRDSSIHISSAYSMWCFIRIRRSVVLLSP